jgi:hypothetical protein
MLLLIRALYLDIQGSTVASCGQSSHHTSADRNTNSAATAAVAHMHLCVCAFACRTCKEVRCKEMWFKDGYGQKLERETICYDPAASLVVTITDTCPCIYPGNYYSNKRWCCGDMYHL